MATKNIVIKYKLSKLMAIGFNSSKAFGGGNRRKKMADTEKLVDQLINLSVLEIAGLVKQVEEKWGVSAAGPVAVAAGGPRGPRPAGGRPARGQGQSNCCAQGQQ